MNEKYEYLMEDTNSISNFLEECVSKDFENWKINNDDNLMLMCKGHDRLSSHNHSSIEKFAWSICNDYVCRYRCYGYEETKVATWMWCYKNKRPHRISEYYGKNIDKLTQEINQRPLVVDTRVCMIDPYLKHKQFIKT